MIECGTRKIRINGMTYYRATIIIDGFIKPSMDYFCTKQTARKQAEFWKYEVVNSRPRKEESQ